MDLRKYRVLARITLVVLFGAVALAGCRESTCTEDSARIELRVTFQGFDRGRAQRIEFESIVRGADYQDEFGDHSDRRVGSIRFPDRARDGEVTFLMNPGSFITGLMTAAGWDSHSASYTLVIRVYGERDGTPNHLLAEGRYVKVYTDRPTCLLDQSLTVSAHATCSQKGEGDPCVGSSGDAGVCRGGTCTDSSCGDGFTDWRNGELCDAGQDGNRCATNCLPHPQQVVVDDTTLPNRMGRIVAVDVQDPATPGFYALGTTSGDATPDFAGALLAVDVDGDGDREILVGLPSADDSLMSGGQVGFVGVMDPPLLSDRSLGFPRIPKYLFAGPAPDPEPSWFGTRMAVGDLDGDGAVDLVVGAPGEAEQRGRVHIFYGGVDGLIRDSDSEGVMYRAGSVAVSQGSTIYTGEEKNVELQPGDHLGYALAVGDFDGDGVDDLAVAAPTRKTPALTSHGVVYVLHGGPDRPMAGYNAIVDFSRVEFRLREEHAMLGIDLAAGDVDGDGFADLVLGSTASASRDGGVYVAFGGPTFFEVAPDDEGFRSAIDLEDPADLVRYGGDFVSHVVSPGQPGEGLGGALAMGDVDGDGYAELAVGLGRRESRVAPWGVALIRGSALAEARASGRALDVDTDMLTIHGDEAHAFGATLTLRDANGSGLADLVIGAPYYSYLDTQSQWLPLAGAVYVLVGTQHADWWSLPDFDIDAALEQPSGSPRLAVVRMVGAAAGGFLGTAVTVADDLGHFNPEAAPRPGILVLEPTHVGVGDSEPRPTVWALSLQQLLPCGDQSPCPSPLL